MSFVATVAVDGSAASDRALAWAMRTSYQNGWMVDVLTVWPVHAAAFVHDVPGHCEPRWRAAELQSASIARALSQIDDAPEYGQRLVNGHVLNVLLAASVGVDVLVLGTDATTSVAGESPETPRKRTRPGRRLTSTVRRLADCPVILSLDVHPPVSPADLKVR